MRVVVIGGGPAGVSAALHAAELGAEVTLVERGRVGGTAFNTGPAPVRTLARAARLVRDWSSWETFGLRGPRPEVDLAATLANAQRVAGYLYERKHCRRPHPVRRVDLVEEAGDARFVDANTVAAADGRKWTADRVIIAVGGKAGRLCRRYQASLCATVAAMPLTQVARTCPRNAMRPSRLQCGDIAAQIALRVMRPRHVLATPKNQMHEVDAAKVASYRPVTNGPTCRLSPTRGALGRCGRRTRLVSSLGATDAYR